jgi:hypothetical protein
MAVDATTRRGLLPLLLVAIAFVLRPASGSALVGDRCAANSDCGGGMRCATCSPLPGSGPAVCSRTTPIDPKTHVRCFSADRCHDSAREAVP